MGDLGIQKMIEIIGSYKEKDQDIGHLNEKAIAIETKYGFKLPSRYLELMKMGNGFIFSGVDFTYKNPKELSSYLMDLWSINDINSIEESIKFMREEILDFSDFFCAVKRHTIHENVNYEKLIEKGVLPSYFSRFHTDNENEDEESKRFYYDIYKYYYLIIDEVKNSGLDQEYIDEFIRIANDFWFYQNCFEFGTFDGHELYTFYFKEVGKEPTVCYIHENYGEWIEIADSFDSFVENLIIRRNEYLFKLNQIDSELFNFINICASQVFESKLDKEPDLEEIENSINQGYSVIYGSEIADYCIGYSNEGCSFYKNAQLYLSICPNRKKYDLEDYYDFNNRYGMKLEEVYIKFNNTVEMLYRLGYIKYFDEISVNKKHLSSYSI